MEKHNHYVLKNELERAKQWETAKGYGWLLMLLGTLAVLAVFAK